MASTAELASGAVAREHPVRSARTVIGGILALAVPLGIWFAPLAIDATPKHALAVSSFMIIAWISEVMPLAVAGLVGCYLFWILGVAKFEVAYSGLVDQTRCGVEHTDGPDQPDVSDSQAEPAISLRQCGAGLSQRDLGEEFARQSKAEQKQRASGPHCPQ